MLRFNYITEDTSEHQGEAANTNGVRHELLVSGVLNHMAAHHNGSSETHPDLLNMSEDELRDHFNKHVSHNGGSGQFIASMPKHFRDKNGQSPTEVYNNHTKKLTDEQHFAHFRNAVNHAKHIHNHLIERGYDPKSINNVHWTSASDNVNSFMIKHGDNLDRKANKKTDDSDLMFTARKNGSDKDEAFGTSLKWKSTSNPAGLKNNTHQTILDPDDFENLTENQRLSEEHKQAIENYKNSAQNHVSDFRKNIDDVYQGTSDDKRKVPYKDDLENEKRAQNGQIAVDSTRTDRVKKAKQLSARRNSNIARELHSTLSGINNSENGTQLISNYVKSKASVPSPDFNAIRGEMQINKETLRDVKHKTEDHSTNMNELLNNVHHYEIIHGAGGEGGSVNIKGKAADGSDLFTLTHTVKPQSRETDMGTPVTSTLAIHKKKTPKVPKTPKRKSTKKVVENDSNNPYYTTESIMSLKDLTYNILSGNLNEAVESFKSLMAEKTLQKIEEKKKGNYNKNLDKNHNGKLDADDFKILRGEKDHKCTAACEETELDEVNKGYSPGWMLKKDPKLGQKIKDTKKAYKELKKEETELEEAGDKPLEKWSGDTRTAKELKTQVRNLDNDTLNKWSKGSSNRFLDSTVKRMQDKLVKSEIRKRQTEEVELDEVLDPSQGVKAYIDDFQKSDDPRFTGDSKEQRRKRAIAAFYAAKKK